jgi:homoserine kinase type II
LAIRTPLTLDEVRVFLLDYVDSPPLALVGVERGTVNSSYEVRLPSDKLFVRLYEEQDFEGARAEAERLAYLARQGVATPAPLARRDAGTRFIGSLAGKPAAVFPWCDGDMRCLRAVTPDDGRRVGEALARLHQAGTSAPRSLGRFEPADLRVRLERIARASEPLLASQAAPLEAKLSTWEARRDPALPRGLIHGDLFRDNVLWQEDGRISALLDFESASDGPLAYDLMVTILAWCFKDTLDVAIARAIAAGYASVRPLTTSERRGLLAEGAIAAIRFTVTRLTDDALRALETGRPPRADKDYRRFLLRLDWLESQGETGLDQALLG